MHGKTPAYGSKIPEIIVKKWHFCIMAHDRKVTQYRLWLEVVPKPEKKKRLLKTIWIVGRGIGANVGEY